MATKLAPGYMSRVVLPALPAEQLELLEQRLRKHLRARMRRTRQAMPESACKERSARIVSRIRDLECFQAARGVGLFWPMAERREVDLRELDAAARAAGKRVYYPFLRGSTTGFAQVSHPDQLAPSAWGFRQPSDDSPLALRGELELVIVPALLFAVDGQRLGYGRGYYDATLPDYCPPAVSLVVGFDFQLTPELPARPGDVAVDWIVTDQRALRAETSDPARAPKSQQPESQPPPESQLPLESQPPPKSQPLLESQPRGDSSGTSASLRWRRARTTAR